MGETGWLCVEVGSKVHFPGQVWTDMGAEAPILFCKIPEDERERLWSPYVVLPINLGPQIPLLLHHLLTMTLGKTHDRSKPQFLNL